MADDAMIRRSNLRRWTRARAWGAGDLSRQVYGRYTYWRDLLATDNKPFGEKAARRFEEAVGLPRLWLDQPEADLDAAASGHIAREPPASYSACPIGWPWSVELWHAVAPLDTAGRRQAERVLRAHLGLRELGL